MYHMQWNVMRRFHGPYTLECTIYTSASDAIRLTLQLNEWVRETTQVSGVKTQNVLNEIVDFSCANNNNITTAQQL